MQTRRQMLAVSPTIQTHYSNTDHECGANIVFNSCSGLVRSGVLCVPHQSLSRNGRLISE